MSADAVSLNAAAALRWIPVLNGHDIRLISIHDVICFEADHKYVVVVTPDGESLITTPLKELLPKLDSTMFWQIHRATIVNVNAIDAAHRLPGGKLQVRLKQVARRLTVSARYMHLFHHM
jgi:DNA-binding LytR/AlgR family response regulator